MTRGGDLPVPPAQGRRRFLAASGLVFAATALSNGLAYLAVILASRTLEPVDYAVVAAMFGLVVILTVPSLALQTLTARETAASRAAPGAGEGVAAVHRRRLDQSLLLGAAVTVVVAGCAIPLAGALAIGSAWPVVVTALAATPILVTSEARGVLLGQERFTTLGVNLVVDGLGRVIATVGALALGMGATGVSAAPAVGTAASALLGLWALRALPRVRRAVGAVVQHAGATLVFYAGYVVLTNGDVVLANRLLESADAGDYAGAAVFGKVVLLAPIAVGAVLVPRVVAEAAAGRSSMRLLGVALAAVGATSGLLAVAGFVAPGLVRTVTVGSDYTGADVLLGPYGLAMAAYAALGVIALFDIALERPVTAWACVAAVPVQIGAFLIVPGRGGALIAVMIVTALALVAIGLAEAGAADRALRRRGGP